MGYKIEKEHYTIPTKLKRNIKLHEEDKKEIQELYASGNYSYRALAELYEVNKSTIAYIVHPERYEEQLRKSKENKSNRKYYNKERHKAYMQRTREYRKALNEMNLLKKGEK